MNSAKDKERTKRWVAANPERSRDIKKRYKLRNREKVLANARAYAARKRSALTDETRQRIREYGRNWHHAVYPNNLNHRIKVILRTRLYKALKGIAKCQRTVELLGCSIESFKLYIESRFEIGMSWENYGDWHIDHIMPCAIFDLTNSEHQKRCFHFSNMQPLWARDNMSKNGKVLKISYDT